MRPTWRGAINFGLVNIPVGLYPATEDKDLHFNLLHEKDQGRIKNQRTCSVCSQALTSDDLVRGFEYAKGKYVTITDEDLRKGETPSSDQIAIQDFVDPSQIEPIFYETPYYVSSDSKSSAAYNLLYQALKSTHKVGIAKVAFRTKERLAALVAGPVGLVLYTMHFADEIRQAEAAPASGNVGEREIKMAEMLIASMTADFDASKYHDVSRQSIEKVIEAKLEGKEVPVAARPAAPTNVIDLMQVLKASIEQNKGKTEEPVETPAAKPKKAAARVA